MGRKTASVTVTMEGRDKGKMFFLTELPASQGEKWAARAFLGLAQGGVEIPDDVRMLGLGGIATIAVSAFGSMPWHIAEPLLDEMMSCVQAMPDPSKPEILRKLIDDDTEEIPTRLWLRKQIIDLHTDFFARAAALKLAASELAAQLRGSNTSTSAP